MVIGSARSVLMLCANPIALTVEVAFLGFSSAQRWRGVRS